MIVPLKFPTPTVLTVIALTVLATVSTSAYALDGHGESFKEQNHAVRGIEEMCGQAATGIARQPEAEGKILGVVRDGFTNINTRKDGTEGIPRAIGVMRAFAIEGVARNPDAEGKLVSLVEECEAALENLKHKSSKYDRKERKQY